MLLGVVKTTLENHNMWPFQGFKWSLWFHHSLSFPLLNHKITPLLCHLITPCWRPTATPGAALQRSLQGAGEGTQVLPPGHRRQADSGDGGPPEAAHGRSSSHTSRPAAPRTAPEGAAYNTSSTNPVNIARVTSYYRSTGARPARQRSAPNRLVLWPLLRGLGGVM
jgi:hypothetical protein